MKVRIHTNTGQGVPIARLHRVEITGRSIFRVSPTGEYALFKAGRPTLQDPKQEVRELVRQLVAEDVLAE